MRYSGFVDIVNDYDKILADNHFLITGRIQLEHWVILIRLDIGAALQILPTAQGS